MTRPTLIIFAKPPRMGLAKTRLAKGVGRAEARRIARFTLARAMRAASRAPVAVRIYVEPARARRETLGGLWPPHIPKYPQAKGDLGARLKRAMLDAPPGPVMFIGADAPGIRVSHLRNAVRALRHKGAVFGPANDGGFWLFGLSHQLRRPEIFDHVRWSTLHAMEDVWYGLPGDARITLLPQLVDIDTAQDWKTYRKQ